MAQRVKDLPHKSDDVSSIPGTHVGRRKLAPKHCLLTTTHVTNIHVQPHMLTHACVYVDSNDK